MNTPWAEIEKTAFEVIEKEQYVLGALKQSVNDSFLKVVHILYTSKGRLVVTGIGKSALVAQKIAATFNSTGTPSLFMHAADALHGDLGMVEKKTLYCVFLKAEKQKNSKCWYLYLSLQAIHS